MTERAQVSQVVLLGMCYRPTHMIIQLARTSDGPCKYQYRSSSMKKIGLWGIIAFIFCSHFRRLSRCRGPIRLEDGRKKNILSIVRLFWLRRKTTK